MLNLNDFKKKILTFNVFCLNLIIDFFNDDCKKVYDENKVLY